MIPQADPVRAISTHWVQEASSMPCTEMPYMQAMAFIGATSRAAEDRNAFAQRHFRFRGTG